MSSTAVGNETDGLIDEDAPGNLQEEPHGSKLSADVRGDKSKAGRQGIGVNELKAYYQKVIKQALHKGDAAQAEALAYEAKQRAVPVSIQKLNWILQAYVKAKCFSEAVKLLESMESDFNVAPTERSYSHLVDGFATLGDAKHAARWLCRMEQSGLNPDIRTLNGMIKCCCWNTDYDPDMSEAFSWLRYIKDQPDMEPDSFSYGHLIFGADRRRNASAAKRWFKEMIGCGLHPSVEVYYFTFQAIRSELQVKPCDAGGACKTWILQFAEEVLRHMESHGVWPDGLCLRSIAWIFGEQRAAGFDKDMDCWHRPYSTQHPGSRGHLQQQRHVAPTVPPKIESSSSASAAASAQKEYDHVDSHYRSKRSRYCS
eukprot:TRINITY_DN1660_c1_g1_i1.p1 TRINITY_DN1660_c1_g1~~TRINITY_DN1660_c1_g1_i1.p1  ORF type:complete len:370 (+),score=59.43 TRINITY_DN1660_c1_g1_i1:85-1194(+)